MPAAAQDHHGVHVLVPIERRKTARCNFEMAKLAVEVGIGKSVRCVIDLNGPITISASCALTIYGLISLSYERVYPRLD